MTTVIDMTIYDRIRSLREEKGMSQQELAELVGFKTASAVNKIELGLRDINQTKIFLFAKALGTTPSYLLDGDEYLKQPAEIGELSDYEKRIIQMVRSVPEDRREDFLAVLEAALKMQK